MPLNSCWDIRAVSIDQVLKPEMAKRVCPESEPVAPLSLCLCRELLRYLGCKQKRRREEQGLAHLHGVALVEALVLLAAVPSFDNASKVVLQGLGRVSRTGVALVLCRREGDESQARGKGFLFHLPETNEAQNKLESGRMYRSRRPEVLRGGKHKLGCQRKRGRKQKLKKREKRD